MLSISRHKLLELLALHFDGDLIEAFRFLRQFNAQTLKIPKMDVIEQLFREEHIVSRIRQNPSTDSVRDLSQTHGLSMRQVGKIFSTATGNSVAAARSGVFIPETPVPRSRRSRIIGPQNVKDCPGQLPLFG